MVVEGRGWKNSMGKSGRCDQKLVPYWVRGIGNVTEGLRRRLSCVKALVY